MRVVSITGPGGPEALEIRDAPDPVPGPEDLLVRVRAAALNRADLLQRRGLYPAPPDAPPDIPGLEFAGEVEVCGERVSAFRNGDRVMGILGGGGQAERVALHHRLCMRLPPTMDWTEAASLPEAFLTAYDALFRQGELGAGEVLLVQAAASGVGTAAVQLGRVAGATVIALSRTPSKRERLERMGFERVLDPGDPGVTDEILRASRGGVDLILDLVGAAAWKTHTTVLRSRGRIVVIGLLGGPRCEVDLAWLMGARATLRGSVLRSRSLEEKITLVQEFSKRILPLFASGKLSTCVDRSVPFREVADAHAVMERNENVGKIVLTLDAP
jgi:putative PIG3 family NAD(P)H quinone oxidoreductase